MAKKVNTKLQEKMEKANARQQLWDLTMSNVQKVGGKHYVFAPMELLFVDERFQRVDENSKGKVNQLIRNWDSNKMDSLKGSVHAEELRISIIDGYHRVMAALALNLPGLEIEILQNMPENPEERLVMEATYFATQGDEVSKLTPVQKHKANVLRGVKENVTVNELIEQHHINLKKNPSRGRVGAGELAGFTTALTIAKNNGKEMLNTVLSILCEARWNLSKNGLSANALATVYNMLRLHPEHKNEIGSALINMFTPIEPDQLFAQAYAKYPNRGEKERILLHVEDIVCETLKITRVYNGGSVSSALSNAA